MKVARNPVLAVIATASCVLGVALFANAPAAQASHDGCWEDGPAVSPLPAEFGFPGNTRYCHNYKTGFVMGYFPDGDGDGSFDFKPVGYLRSTTSWFVCQIQFLGSENPAVGEWRNDIWLYTQGDEAYANGGWGWFPATYVSGGANYGPIPGLQQCSDGIPLIGAAAPATAPASLDVAAPVRQPAAQPSIAATARCGNFCELRGRAVIRSGKVAAKSDAVTAPATPGAEVALQLPIDRGTRTKVKRLLRAGQKVQVKVRVQAAGPGGEVKRKAVKLRMV